MSVVASGYRPWVRLGARGVVAWPVAAIAHASSSAVSLLDAVSVNTLALAAVDAARSAGATYADVRLTRVITQQISIDGEILLGARVDDDEQWSVGIRALVDGAWGFAASPYWDLDEMAVLGREAVAQARENVDLNSPRVELIPAPVAKGTWVMPGVDPLTISIEEKLDLLHSWRTMVADARAGNLRAAPIDWALAVTREERVFASTDGSLTAQTSYSCDENCEITISGNIQSQMAVAQVWARGRGGTRQGWERIRDAAVPAQLPRLFEDGERLMTLVRKPGEMGRYDIVCSAGTTGMLLSATLGGATELDRALGFEANASGTSYLGPDPLALLGTPVASPLLSLAANRSTPGARATVAWDDEGVVPAESFPIVANGVLTNFQTTREQASWLTPYYQKIGRPIPLHGCATAPSASDAPLQHRPNLVMAAGAREASFSELVGGISRGIAIVGGRVQMDWQNKTGTLGGEVAFRAIANGTLGPALQGIELRFSAPELWKNLKMIGGAGSQGTIEREVTKGEPSQRTGHSVTAVPAVFTNVTVVRAS